MLRVALHCYVPVTFSTRCIPYDNVFFVDASVVADIVRYNTEVFLNTRYEEASILWSHHEETREYIYTYSFNEKMT